MMVSFAAPLPLLLAFQLWETSGRVDCARPHSTGLGHDFCRLGRRIMS